MLKRYTLALCVLLIPLVQTTHTMDYAPKFLKSGRFWGTVALAAVVSGAIYCIEYWQDAPNRDLFDAVCAGDFLKAALALEDGASITRRGQDGSTLLHYAVHKGHYKLVPVLTQASLPSIIDSEDKARKTPLQYAVEKEDALMVHALICAGASKFDHTDTIDPVFEEKVTRLVAQAQQEKALLRAQKNNQTK